MPLAKKPKPRVSKTKTAAGKKMNFPDPNYLVIGGRICSEIVYDPAREKKDKTGGTHAPYVRFTIVCNAQAYSRRPTGFFFCEAWGNTAEVFMAKGYTRRCGIWIIGKLKSFPIKGAKSMYTAFSIEILQETLKSLPALRGDEADQEEAEPIIDLADLNNVSQETIDSISNFIPMEDDVPRERLLKNKK